MVWVTRESMSVDGAYITFRKERLPQLRQDNGTFPSYPTVPERWIHTTNCYRGGVMSMLLSCEGFTRRSYVKRIAEMNVGIHSLLDVPGVEAKFYRYAALARSSHESIAALIQRSPQTADSVLMAWASEDRGRINEQLEILNNPHVMQHGPTTDLIEIIRVEPASRNIMIMDTPIPLCSDFITRQHLMDFQASFDVVARMQDLRFMGYFI